MINIKQRFWKNGNRLLLLSQLKANCSDARLIQKLNCQWLCIKQYHQKPFIETKRNLLWISRWTYGSSLHLSHLHSPSACRIYAVMRYTDHHYMRIHCSCSLVSKWIFIQTTACLINRLIRCFTKQKPVKGSEIDQIKGTKKKVNPRSQKILRNCTWKCLLKTFIFHMLNNTGKIFSQYLTSKQSLTLCDIASWQLCYSS